jgi:hypothetical protein
VRRNNVLAAEKATFGALVLFAAVVVTVNAGPRAPGHPKKPQAASADGKQYDRLKAFTISAVGAKQ